MSKVDVKKKIDDQIRKLKELKRFMDDPATAPFIEQLISSNGAVPAEKKYAQLPLVQSTARGELIGAVEDACRKSAGKDFTSKQVIKDLRELGFNFHAKNIGVAVNSALKRLTKRGVLELVQRASGKRPATYRIPQRFPREMKGTAA